MVGKCYNLLITLLRTFIDMHDAIRVAMEFLLIFGEMNLLIMKC